MSTSNKNTLLKGLFFSTAITLSQFASAATMTLDESTSSLNLVSIKNGTIGEVHTIPKLTGSLSEKGELDISIFLSSIETNIEIRNTRINRHVFESEANPIATYR